MESSEQIRNKYRPDSVSTLFVGESPPANGTFFYKGDSRLFRYTCEAFGCSTADVSSFLSGFKSQGFFLVDLCSTPVNNLPPRERRRARNAGVPRLAREIEELQPKAIVVVMKAIADHVHRALGDSGLRPEQVHVLPFPAQGHEREYVSRLSALLRSLPRT